MSDQLTNSPEQPPQEKTVKPDSSEQPLEEETAKPKGKVKIRSSLNEPNYLLQNISYIGGLFLSITAIIISLLSYNKANKQFKENAEKSDSLFDVQYENERMINDNLEKILKQSDSQYKTQSELTNTQIAIIDQQLKDQISSGAPQIIVNTATLINKNTLIEGMYEAVIEIKFKNSGRRNAYNVMFRTFGVTDDFSTIFSNIGYSGSNNFLGFNEEAEFKFSPRFVKPIPIFYFCYEITYLDKFTGKKDGYTTFSKLTNENGKDRFVHCNTQTSNKIRELINALMIKRHENILHK